jgi:hypothetical protein
MGVWMKTVQQVATAVTGAVATRIALPKANFIGEVVLTIHGCGHANQTAATMRNIADPITVIGDGGIQIKSLSSGQIRTLDALDFGQYPSLRTTTSTTIDSWVIIPIEFGRFSRDELVICPAKSFKTLDLVINWVVANLGFFTTASFLDVCIDEYIGADDPLDKILSKEVQIDSVVAGTTVVRTNLPLGNLYRGLLMYQTVMGGNNYDTVQVNINNASDIPFAWTRLAIISENYMKSPLEWDYGEYSAVGLLTTTYSYINFDHHRDFRGCMDSKQMNDFTLVNPRTASSTMVVVTRELVLLK